ncbi:MAG: helix-turn-helix transcriptional regulator [Desulfobacterales bacterium]|nr:helix-turn-helix transcriptional regulator [Desulfobacterales bacterium]
MKRFNPEKIVELRKKAGLNQTQLSELTKKIDETGISENSIWKIENNKNIPSVNALALIAEALKVKNFNQFFEEEEKSEGKISSKEYLEIVAQIKALEKKLEQIKPNIEG